MLNENTNKVEISKDSDMHNIIQNLQIIEQIASNENITTKEFDKLKKIIINCMDWGYKELKNNDSDTSLQIFELWDYFDTKLNFTKIFKNNNISLINNINIATCYQINWNLENNLIYLEKSYEILTNIINEEKKKKCYKNYLNQLKYLFLNSKICLQIAAVSSQLLKHNESYKWDIISFNSLKDILNLIKILTNVDKKKKKCNYSINNEDLDYFNNLIFNNKNICKGFNSLCISIEKINENLINNFNIEVWKNDDIFNFKIDKINTDWIEFFNIGNIMHLEPVKYKKINQEFFFDDFLNQDFFAIIVLIMGCCLFSIATEKRFILNSKFNKDKKVFNHLKESEHVSFKYQSSPDFIQSQYFHNFSIDLIEKFVGNNELLKHLKSSFKKNYKKKFLEVIKEEDELNISYTTIKGEYEFYEKNITRSDNRIEGNILQKSQLNYNYWKESIDSIKEKIMEKKYTDNKNINYRVKKSPKAKKFKLKPKKKNKNDNIESWKNKLIKNSPKPMLYNFIKKKSPKKILFNKSKLSSKNSVKSNKKIQKNTLQKSKKSTKNLNSKQILWKNTSKKKFFKEFNNSNFNIKKDEVLKLKLNKKISKKKIINKTKYIQTYGNNFKNILETIKIKSFYNKQNKSNISWKKNIDSKAKVNNSSNENLKKFKKNRTERNLNDNLKKNNDLNKLLKNVYKGNQKPAKIFKIIKSNKKN